MSGLISFSPTVLPYSGQHLLPHPFYSCLRCTPQLGLRPPHFFFIFLDHIQLDTQTYTHTSGRTPLNDRSARRIGPYLRNKPQRQETNIHALRGVRTPPIPAVKRHQTYAFTAGHRDQLIHPANGNARRKSSSF